MNPTEMLEKRAQLIKDARKLHDEARDAKRDLTAEERQKFDAMMDDADRLHAEARSVRRLEDAEKSLDQPANPVHETRTASRGVEREDRAEPTDAEQRDAWLTYMRTGEQRAGFAPALSGTVGAGGYLAPTKTARKVIDRLQDVTYMMRPDGAMQYPLPDAKGISIPTVATAMTGAAWAADGASVTVDSAGVTGQVSLTPYRLQMEGYVTEHLLQTSQGLAEEMITTHITRRMAEALDAAFIEGDGSSAPTGIFDSSGGASNSVTATSQTAITYGELVETMTTVRLAYRTNAKWFGGRVFVRKVMSMVDGTGRPIWIPSIQPGVPDMLLGHPVWETEGATADFTSGDRVCVFGDPKGYAVAYAEMLRFKRLVEKYASTDSIGYLAILYADGKIQDQNAFAALDLA